MDLWATWATCGAHLHEQLEVGHAAAHRPRARTDLLLPARALAPRRGHAARADAVVGRLEAGDATHGRGQSDRTTHVGADAEGRAARRDERALTAAAAAAGPAEVVRVARRAPHGVGRLGQHQELRYGRAHEGDRALRARQRHQQRVLLARREGAAGQTARRVAAGHVDLVLDGDRQPVQRATRGAARALSVGRCRLSDRCFEALLRVALQRAAHRHGAGDEAAHDVLGAELAPLHRADQCGGRHLHHLLGRRRQRVEQRRPAQQARPVEPVGGGALTQRVARRPLAKGALRKGATPGDAACETDSDEGQNDGDSGDGDRSNRAPVARARWRRRQLWFWRAGPERHHRP